MKSYTINEQQMNDLKATLVNLPWHVANPILVFLSNLPVTVVDEPTEGKESVVEPVQDAPSDN